MAYPKTTADTDFNVARFWMTIAGICAVIIFGSVFVTRSYMKRREYEAANYRPPHISKLEKDLEAINRDGRTVRLSELKHKIWVMGYMYTDCPSGCIGMASYLEELERAFGDRENFHLVSISLNPSEDTPEKINDWVVDHDIDLPDWWFLTGDETEIREYMQDWFHLSYGEESTDPDVVAAKGKFDHVPRLVLIDGIADIRGYYQVMRTDIGEQEFERLKKDVGHLFEEVQPTTKEKSESATAAGVVGEEVKPTAGGETKP